MIGGMQVSTRDDCEASCKDSGALLGKLTEPAPGMN